MTPTEKELEQARAFYDEHYKAFDDGNLDLEDMLEFATAFRTDGQREVFERAIEIVQGHGAIRDYIVRDLRADFPQFSKPGEGQ
jgi:hypothetical protein